MANRPADKFRYYDPTGTAEAEKRRRDRMQSILDRIEAQDPNAKKKKKKKKKDDTTDEGSNDEREK